jgi:hypothetical protein
VHLHNRYKLASNLKDSRKKHKIMQVIRWEEQKDDWNWIQCATGELRLGATPKVHQIENGKVIDIVVASKMNREVQIVTEQWFDLECPNSVIIIERVPRFLFVKLNSLFNYFKVKLAFLWTWMK